ncbi:MAG: T9SS type B sorting domain-containing protein [Weeksellaceae bacterium]|nr:T9SS type B sorting domain-containing protein [Weeksellaceae bacterium]
MQLIQISLFGSSEITSPLRLWFVGLFFLFSFSVFAQNANTTCDTAAPACPDQNFGVNMPSQTGSGVAEQGPNYGCLASQPRPLWYYMQVSHTGTVEFLLTQTTQPNGMGNEIDIDFIIWGPFDSPTGNCNNLTAANIVDCSYHPSFSEYVDFNPATSGPVPSGQPGTANAGEYYILLITNYGGQAGYINMQPTGTMSAIFNCDILDDTRYICDEGGDGVEMLDMNDYTEELLDGSTNFSISYHTSLEDASSNINPITTPQSLTHEGLLIYARKRNLTTNTYVVVIMTFNLRDLPEMNDATLTSCELTNGNGSWKLTEAQNEITNGNSSVNLSFHNSLADAQAGSNPIATNYIGNPTEIYVRAELQGCVDYAVLSLDVLPIPELPAVEDEFCLSDLTNNTVNLTQYNPSFTTGNESVSYFVNQAAFESNTPIANPQSFPVTAGALQLIVKVDTQPCYSTSFLNLSILPFPVIQDHLLQVCDLEMDGVATWDLNDAVQFITNGNNAINISFHSTLADAQSGNNAIGSNYTGLPTTVFVRGVEGDCFATAQLALEIISVPTITDVDDILCENDLSGNQVNLNSYNTSFSNNDAVSYYLSMADLIAGNPVAAPQSYVLQPGFNQLFVKVDTAPCYSISHLNLQLNANPILQNASLQGCDIQGNNTAIWNLMDAANELSNGNAGINFTFHATQNDAINGNAPLSIQHSGSAGVVFVRGELNGCYSTAQLSLEVLPIPQIPSYSLTVCASDLPNNAINLNLYNQEFAGNGETVTYYNSLQQLHNNNPISLPQNQTLVVGNNVFYVKIGTQPCYSVSEIHIDVLPSPQLGDNEIIKICPESFPYTLQLTGSDANYTSYEWTPGGQTGSSLTVQTYGVYAVTVYDENHCSATKTFEVLPRTPITLLELEILDNNTVRVVYQGDGADMLFSLDGSEWQTSPVFYNVSPGLHSAIARYSDGCETEPISNFLLYVYNVITPNNDGYNDRFEIPGLDQLEGVRISIIDRYGKLLYQNEGDGVFRWNGTYNGRPLPTGDYWYIIHFPDGRVHNGSITLRNFKR